MSKGEGAERIALYMRVSSEEQAERMTIKTQDEFLDQYCALYGHEVAGVYKDEAHLRDGADARAAPGAAPAGRREERRFRDGPGLPPR